VPPGQDMSRYLGLFVAESIEHLEALSRDLLTLERERVPGTVDSLFRHAHSVKGMAASMGLESIATLAHRLEDLVDVLRRDGGGWDQGLVDLMLEAVDAMQAQVRAAPEGSPPPAGLLERLAGTVQTRTGQPPAPTRIARTLLASSPPGASAQEEPARLEVVVQVLASSSSPGVRAYLVHRRLAALGTVLSVAPSLEELRAGAIAGGRVSLAVAVPGGPAAVRAALSSVPEVELISIRPLAGSDPPASEAPTVGLEPAHSVRVRTELLDDFLELAGELLLATARLREIGKRLPEAHAPVVEEGVGRLYALAKDMHNRVMGARMTPLAVVTDQLPRAVRDVARRRGREVDLTVEGAEIELDRAILDVLADPLHVLRNAVDHGIEDGPARVAAGKPPRGSIRLAVRRARDRVVIEVSDDGRGMDVEGLRAAAVARGALTAEAAARLPEGEVLLLACHPGVSTARDVSDVSGRGVGMDAVKRAVERVGGTLELASEPGRGTRVAFRLPLTVAVLQLLLVRAGGEVLGLPITKVLGALELGPSELERSDAGVTVRHGKGRVPVHAMASLLGFAEPEPRSPQPLVLMEADRGPVALAVEALLGQEEAVVKALSRPLDQLPGLAGVTILGSGRPVFILDVPRLLA
jgi:two-component system, chemotaxis family, sensor kinase CheA